MTSVVNSLRNSSKGQLSYARHVNTKKLKDDLDLLSSPPLSHPHEERECSLNESLGLDGSFTSQGDFNDNACESTKLSFKLTGISQALSDLDDEIEKSDTSKDDVFDSSLPVLDRSSSSPPKKRTTSCPVSPQFGITTGAILDKEAMWDSIAQLCFLKRTRQYEDHDRAISFLLKSKEKDAERRIQRLVESRDGLVKQKQDECLAITKPKLQRLKEDHKEHHKKIHYKQQEIERHREKLEEEEKKRQESEMMRLNEFNVLFGDVKANRNSFAQMFDGCALRNELPEIMEKYRAVLDKVCASMANDSQQLSTGAIKSVTDEHMAKAKENKDKSQQAIIFLKRSIAEAEEKKKEEEVRKEEELKKKEEKDKLAAEAAQDFGVQSLAYVLKDYQTKSTLLSEIDKTVQAFTSNVDMKKFRFDLQRAVNTPINAISPVSGSHLRDKLKRLHALLTGQLVDIGTKQVSLNNSEEGKVFCQNLVAKMLVKKGEEQVTSNHESAFAIASVVVGLWVEIPVVGDLFLAHLQAMCPYILPLYNTRMEGQSTEDYHRSLGYKIMEDKSVEEQDKFLHRMSGLMHLYCACIVSSPPKGPNSPHPLGIHHAWMWLARTFNMEPQPDVTASMIYDVLFVTGHFLFQEYKIQFIKLLHLLYKQYLPKLKSVSVTKSTVGRLEIFLETTLQNNGRIEPPKGLLPANFLLS